MLLATYGASALLALRPTITADIVKYAGVNVGPQCALLRLSKKNT